MQNNTHNYYKDLGLTRSANDKEIRGAYRRLARKYHPDLNQEDEKAAEHFKRVTEAYEVLSDSDSRSKYDRYGSNWKNAQRTENSYVDFSSPFTKTRTGHSRNSGFSNPFGNLEDLISGTKTRRRTPAEPNQLQASVDITLEEAITGTKRTVTVTKPDGERRLEVTIPSGVKTGSIVRITPEKDHQLNLNIKVKPHDQYTRRGNDLVTEVNVPLDDIVLGGELEIQTPRSKLNLKIPPASQNGQKIRLAGQGMPKLGSPKTVGDLIVILRPLIPENLTESELELFRNLRDLRS